MQLEHLMDLTGRLRAPYHDAGEGPYGTRYIYNAAEGEFEGPYLKGKLLPGGGDWPIAVSNGTMHLDIRIALETDDGAIVYLKSRGVWRQEATDDGTEGTGRMYIVSTPEFETGDDRYRWLNDFVYLAEGEVEMLDGEAFLAEITWHIHRVLNG